MFGEKRVSKEFLEKSIEAASKLHDKIIEHSGGTIGVRDEGGLYHSIYKILLYQEENLNNPVSVGAFVYEEMA